MDMFMKRMEELFIKNYKVFLLPCVMHYEKKMNILYYDYCSSFKI